VSGRRPRKAGLTWIYAGFSTNYRFLLKSAILGPAHEQPPALAIMHKNCRRMPDSRSELQEILSHIANRLRTANALKQASCTYIIVAKAFTVYVLQGRSQCIVRPCSTSLDAQSRPKHVERNELPKIAAALSVEETWCLGGDQGRQGLPGFMLGFLQIIASFSKVQSWVLRTNSPLL
jgi:hypothetical protein